MARTLLVFSLVVSLAVASSASAARPNVCLLTNAEVGKALGGKVAGRTGGGNETRGYSCTWTGPTLQGFFSVTRTLVVNFSREPRAEFDRQKAHSQESGALIIAVRGLGFEAYEDQGPLDVLDVWQSGYAFSVIANEVPSPLETEKALAKIALPRL